MLRLASAAAAAAAATAAAAAAARPAAAMAGFAALARDLALFLCAHRRETALGRTAVTLWHDYSLDLALHRQVKKRFLVEAVARELTYTVLGRGRFGHRFP